jgi:hypothetical protein
VNILITAANSAQAHRLKNNLLSAGHVILGDYMDLPAFMLIPGKMVKLPDPLSLAYAHEMLTLCMDNDVDTIYPLKEQEYQLLAEARQLFKEYNIDIRNASDEI